MQLSFGEQVKIVLKRQGITIKELASRIEEQTGKKMSRQNLTQRLGRDNFQEQDMFMVANALGCTLTINLLDADEPAEAAAPVEKAVPAAAPAPAATEEPVIEEEVKAAEEPAAAPETVPEPEPVQEPVAEAQPEPVMEEEMFDEEEFEDEALPEAEAEAAEPAEETGRSKFRPLTWYRKGHKKEEAPVAQESAAQESVQEPVYEEPIEVEEEPRSRDDLMRELNADIAALGDSGPIILDDIPERGRFDTDPEAESAFEREKEALLMLQREDRNAELPPEQLPTTSVNPYTLREYKSNTVRAHASRIGYVQVYSRQTHAWQDMTEWAFMGEQDRRRTLLGDQYEEPTYLD